MKAYMIAVAMSVVSMFVAAGEHDHHAKEGHAHKAPHGGTVKTIGQHHAEWVADHDGKVHVYILGEDEKIAQPIDAKEITAQVKIHGHDEFKAVTLKSEPLKGEKEGASSHFVGTAEFLKGAKAYQAVLQINVGGKSHRATFEGVGKHGEKGHQEKKHDH